MTPVSASISILVKIQSYFINYFDSFAAEDIDQACFLSIISALAVIGVMMGWIKLVTYTFPIRIRTNCQVYNAI